MKFPSLPAASALTGVEVVPMTQGGVDKRSTAQAIANTADAAEIAFANSGFSAINVYDAIVEASSISGGSSTVTINTEASTSTMTPATHSGLAKYNRCAGNVTFNTSQSYTTGEVYNIRATASITLIGTGVTLTAPNGGTLGMNSAMAVTVIMTSSTAGDVIGQTVPA